MRRVRILTLLFIHILAFGQQQYPKFNLYVFEDSIQNQKSAFDFNIIDAFNERDSAFNYVYFLVKNDTLQRIEVLYKALKIAVSTPIEFQCHLSDFLLIEFSLNLNGEEDCYWINLCSKGNNGRGLQGPAGADCNKQHYAQFIRD
jgi:hypothetical protein